MPTSKQLPASVRYLKARLKVLERPMVWGSASVLLLAIVLLAEYWSAPERFVGLGDRQPSLEETESSEALPQLAPLDPLSSVDDPLIDPLSELSPEQLSQLSPETASNLEALNSPSLPPLAPSSLPPSATNQFTNPPTPSSAAPQSNSDQSALDIPNAPPLPGLTDTPLLSGFSSGFSSAPETNADAATPQNEISNPLQTAIEQQRTPTSQATPAPTNSFSNNYSTPNYSTPPTTSSEESGGFSSSSPSEQFYTTPQPLPGQPSLNQTTPPPQYVPQTSPYPGTTGYTQPPAFRTPTPPTPNSTQSLSPIRSVSPSPQSDVSTPFSVPRTAPGQFIGGGEINTFSNP